MDYCTGVPDGKASEACKEHDIFYGEVWEFRHEADKIFYENMIKDGVNKYKAKLYYYGVRIFGRLFV